MNKFLFNSKDILTIIHPLLEYIHSIFGHKPKEIAQTIGISPSYFYTLRNIESDISIESRRSFFVKLLKSYKLSVEKDNEGGISFIHEQKKSYYIFDCYLYLYEKDSKSFEVFKGKIDLLERNSKFQNLNTNKYYYGRYYELDEHTSWELITRIPFLHYDSDVIFWDGYPEDGSAINYGGGQVKEIKYEISLCGKLSSVNENPLFGFFTRFITYSKIFSGWAYISDDELKDLPREVMIYLTSQKFHELFNYDIQVESLEELKPYVEEFEEKVRLIQLEIPEELVTSYQQFLSFFSNYVEVTKGKSIKFDVLKNQDGLTIDLELLDGSITMSEVKIYIEEYLEFSKQNINDLRVNIEADLSLRKFDIFILELKQQINNLKQSLEIANLKNDFLEKDKEYFKELLGKFAGKESNIHLQLINGGEQQFADKIKNHEN